MSEQDYISPMGKGRGKLPEDKLMAYLHGTLSPEEQHEVEQWLADEGMESDAMEGLLDMPPGETQQTVNRLNHKLRKSLVRKPRTRKKIGTDLNLIAAVGIILLLAIVAFMVIRYMR